MDRAWQGRIKASEGAYFQADQEQALLKLYEKLVKQGKIDHGYAWTQSVDHYLDHCGPCR